MTFKLSKGIVCVLICVLPAQILAEGEKKNRGYIFHSIGHLKYSYTFYYKFVGGMVTGSVKREELKAKNLKRFEWERVEPPVTRRFLGDAKNVKEGIEMNFGFGWEQKGESRLEVNRELQAPFNTPNPRTVKVIMKSELGGLTITVPWQSRVWDDELGEHKWITHTCTFYDEAAIETLVERAQKDLQQPVLEEERFDEIEFLKKSLSLIAHLFRKRDKPRRNYHALDSNRRTYEFTVEVRARSKSRFVNGNKVAEKFKVEAHSSEEAERLIESKYSNDELRERVRSLLGSDWYFSTLYVQGL